MHHHPQITIDPGSVEKLSNIRWIVYGYRSLYDYGKFSTAGYPTDTIHIYDVFTIVICFIYPYIYYIGTLHSYLLAHFLYDKNLYMR